MKTGAKYTRKVLDYLFHEVTRRQHSAEEFINEILYNNPFYHPGTILAVMVKVIFGLHCA
jgi:hypothetical protein